MVSGIIAGAGRPQNRRFLWVFEQGSEWPKRSPRASATERAYQGASRFGNPEDTAARPGALVNGGQAWDRADAFRTECHGATTHPLKGNSVFLEREALLKCTEHFGPN